MAMECYDDFAVKTPLKITDTILRDAHQSQAATRMTIEDMLPACKVLDSIGYWSLECWGGATFDSCMRFLGEDPWERLRKLRKALPNTRLQMLFRGQNILGYKHYADDVVDAFCRKSIENGIDVVRIFDALNDTRNLRQAIDSVKKYKGWVEAAMSYTTSPVHNEEYFVKLAKQLESMGADSICIKDMANLLLPMEAYSLVKKLKAAVKVPIHLHTHNTTGTGDLVNLMAAYAGVDIVDTALSPLASALILSLIGSIGNGCPITPVDATITSSSAIPSSFAASSHIICAFSTPSALQVFAFLLFAITALALLPDFARFSFVTIIGAPFTLFVVYTAAA